MANSGILFELSIWAPTFPHNLMSKLTRIQEQIRTVAGYWGNRLRSRLPANYLAAAQDDFEQDAKTGKPNTWAKRLNEILDCPDTKDLEYQPEAGRVFSGYQVMHNGIKVPLGSYYGRITAKVFEDSKGVHEPQEERAFGQFLKNLSGDTSAPTMMELGAYWAFYSAWFKKTFPKGRSILVEPMWENMQFGQSTFALNGLNCESIRALIGDSYVPAPKLSVVSIPWLFEHFKIETLDLLHSDIQGFERDMLQGAKPLLDAKRIRALFVSTHGDDVHQACEAMIREAGYMVALNLPQRDSYAYDGMIIAARPGDEPLLADIRVSRRTDVHPVDTRGW